MTAANPQVGSGYFSHPIMVYDGDTVARVIDRVKRKAGTPGEVSLQTQSRAISPHKSFVPQYKI